MPTAGSLPFPMLTPDQYHTSNFTIELHWIHRLDSYIGFVHWIQIIRSVFAFFDGGSASTEKLTVVSAGTAVNSRPFSKSSFRRFLPFWSPS